MAITRYCLKHPALYLLPAVMLWWGCAHQVVPTGGDRDVMPPKVEKMVPENKSTSFRKKEIVIHFDEFVVLNNATEQVVISPPPDEKPEIYVSGKTVRVAFRKPLKPNTTYTINFGNAVTDNHEGNVSENLSYVFSTGRDIDTGFLAGQVIRAFNNKAAKSVIMGLYSAEGFNDSTIFRQKPVYFTKTRENGSYRIENIPYSSFYLVAFNDDNKSLRYNQNEDIGFRSAPLQIGDTTIQAVNLKLFTPDAYAPNRLLDTFVRDQGKFTFLVYQPSGFLVKPTRAHSTHRWDRSGASDIDSIFIFTDSKPDARETFRITTKDSSYEVTIKPRGAIKPPAFSTPATAISALNDSITVNLSNPLSKLDTSRIILMEDTNRVMPGVFISNLDDQIRFYHPWKEQTNYRFVVKDSALTDIYQQRNRGARLSFTTKTLKDFSTLALTVQLRDTLFPYIIQLMSEDESRIIRSLSVTSTSDHHFEYLEPGTYLVKIIEDVNANGKWDNGSYTARKQPERVFYFPEKIVLKAYWDMEQTIRINSLIADQ